MARSSPASAIVNGTGGAGGVAAALAIVARMEYADAVMATNGKVGRNEPCPCGSGKKFKACCQAKQEATAWAARDQREKERAAKNPPPNPTALLAKMRELLGVDEEEPDDLTEKSNHAVDLLDAGRLDEAEECANDLCERYPEMFDGPMRLGQIYRARGEPKKAAVYLRMAAEKAAADGINAPEIADSLRVEADELDPPATAEP